VEQNDSRYRFDVETGDLVEIPCGELCVVSKIEYHCGGNSKEVNPVRERALCE